MSAESALEKLAATMPIVKSTVTDSLIMPVAVNIGIRSSLEEGRGMPSLCANIMSKMPKESSSKLAGTKAKP